MCVSKKFSILTETAWMYDCARRWPQWHEIARAPDTQWRRQYELEGGLTMLTTLCRCTVLDCSACTLTMSLPALMKSAAHHMRPVRGSSTMPCTGYCGTQAGTQAVIAI